MIVLDTNVISELMKEAPDSRVRDWAQAARVAELWIASTTVAEVFVGIERLPDGGRKRALAAAAMRWIDDVFRDRVLAFGGGEARIYASLVAIRLRSGHPIGMPDAQIAAIALAHGATLATRNVKDFEGIGIDLVNPWEAPGTM
jgi:predicted nucleic acid-binding protein